MTQQEKTLTTTQNELGHAPLVRLYLTSLTSCQQKFSCLSSRLEMVIVGTGTTVRPVAVPLSK